MLQWIAKKLGYALVPIGGDWAVGEFTLDEWERFEGSRGLQIVLSKEQCRMLSQQLLSN